MEHTAPTRVGLALSGGAARGFAHIGAVKGLVEHGVSFSCIAGTSVGSIVGALLAGGYEWGRILEIGRSLKWKELVAPTLSGLGLVTSRRLEAFMDDLLGNVTFADLVVPFRAVAVDITRGRQVVFDDGPVAPAVRASSAIPGIFEPVVAGERVLVDGGVMNNLPSDVVRAMGAEHVVGVDLNGLPSEATKPAHLIDVSFRSFAMLVECTSAKGRAEADVVIRPDLSAFSYHDLTRADELVAIGERAAIDALPQIRRLAEALPEAHP